MKWIKGIAIAIVVIVILMILNGDAVGAAHFVNSIASGLTSFGSGVADFFAHLHL